MAAPEKKKAAPSRRVEILQAATDLFLQKGYAGTSMADVANACSIQKASLYYHFKTKEELFAACITEGHACTLDELEAISRDQTMAPREKLRAAIENLYDINVGSDVGRMSPLIAEVSREIPYVAKRFHEDFMQKEEGLMRSIIDEGIERGVFADIDPIALKYMIVGPIITLSLAREMFASFDNLDEECPVDHIRHHHIEHIMRIVGRDSSAEAKS